MCISAYGQNDKHDKKALAASFLVLVAGCLQGIYRSLHQIFENVKAPEN